MASLSSNYFTLNNEHSRKDLWSGYGVKQVNMQVVWWSLTNQTKACLISVWYLLILRHRWICQCDAKFHRVDWIGRSWRTWKMNRIMMPTYLTPCSWASNGCYISIFSSSSPSCFQFLNEHQAISLNTLGVIAAMWVMWVPSPAEPSYYTRYDRAMVRPISVGSFPRW
jgi:hypothetical protein